MRIPDAPPQFTESQLDRLTLLRRQRFDIASQLKAVDDEIASLLGRPPDGARPLWGPCRRCGYVWEGHWPNSPPKHCARCHSSGWMSDPRPGTRCRRPSDPPDPRWYRRKRPSKIESARATTLPPPPPPADLPHYMRPQPKVEPQPETVVARNVPVVAEEVMSVPVDPTNPFGSERAVTEPHLVTSDAAPEPKDADDGPHDAPHD